MIGAFKGRSGLFAGVAAGLLMFAMIPEEALAHSGDSAVTECRTTVGQPMVQPCVQSRMQREGGRRRHFVEHCRLSVSWAVRACVWRSAAVVFAVTGR